MFVFHKEYLGVDHEHSYFCIILDVQRANTLNETRQKNQERHLWQLVITNTSTSTEKRVKIGTIFNVSSNHVTSLTIKNGNSSGTRLKVLNVRQNVHLPSKPDEMQAGKEPDGLNVTRKALRHPE